MSRMPAEIKTLHKVTILNWCGNAVNDSAHISSMLRPLRDLAYLYLRDNKLTSIPDLSHNQKLEHLELDNNAITDAKTNESMKQIENKQTFIDNWTRIHEKRLKMSSKSASTV